MARLMIVEDRKMSQEMLYDTIRQWKMFEDIDCVDSYEGAVELLSNNKYDCLLLDLQIWDMKPKRDGTRPIGDQRDTHHGLKILNLIMPEYANKLYIFSVHIDEVADVIEKMGLINRLLPRPVNSALLKQKLVVLAEGPEIE